MSHEATKKAAFNHPACLLSPTQASLFHHHQGHVGYRWFWARALSHTSRHGRVRKWSIHTQFMAIYGMGNIYYIQKKVIPHSRRNSYWSLSWGAVGMPPALLITVYMVKPRHPRSLAQFFFSHHAFPWHRQQLRCSVLEHTDVDLTQKSWVWNIWIWEA
jgi:hypothetical protein